MKNQMFITTLVNTLSIKRSTAALIDRYLNEDEFTLRKHPKLKKYLNECYCYPSRHELALELAGKLSDKDVEGFQLNNGDEILFLNTGDVYDETLIWDGRNNEFIVGSVGNILEEEDLEEECKEDKENEND